jgi:hypothetical protein
MSWANYLPAAGGAATCTVPQDLPTDNAPAGARQQVPERPLLTGSGHYLLQRRGCTGPLCGVGPETVPQQLQEHRRHSRAAGQAGRPLLNANLVGGQTGTSAKQGRPSIILLGVQPANAAQLHSSVPQIWMQMLNLNAECKCGIDVPLSLSNRCSNNDPESSCTMSAVESTVYTKGYGQSHKQQLMGTCFFVPSKRPVGPHPPPPWRFASCCSPPRVADQSAHEAACLRGPTYPPEVSGGRPPTAPAPCMQRNVTWQISIPGTAICH